MWIFISIILAILGYKLYKFAMKDLDYFERPNQRIKYDKAFPLVGSDFGAFFRKEPVVKLFTRNYKRIKNEKWEWEVFSVVRSTLLCRNFFQIFQLNKWHSLVRLYGAFTIFNKPAVTLVDPKIVKQLVVREFEHFIDHQGFGNSADPLLDKTLIALKGHEWKGVWMFQQFFYQIFSNNR